MPPRCVHILCVTRRINYITNTRVALCLFLKVTWGTKKQQYCFVENKLWIFLISNFNFKGQKRDLTTPLQKKMVPGRRSPTRTASGCSKSSTPPVRCQCRRNPPWRFFAAPPPHSTATTGMSQADASHNSCRRPNSPTKALVRGWGLREGPPKGPLQTFHQTQARLVGVAWASKTTNDLIGQNDVTEPTTTATWTCVIMNEKRECIVLYAQFMCVRAVCNQACSR